MHIADMREAEPGTVLETDLAIIGTGPAGLSIAHEFLGSSHQVVLLESGGLKETDTICASEMFENIGLPRIAEPRLVRNRVLGGSSHTWSGRCRSFDRIDYEYRSWVPFSGWPLTHDEMQIYENRAAEAMNLGPNFYGHELWNLLDRGYLEKDLSQNGLEACFWQYSRDPDRPFEFLRFGPRFLKQKSDNITVFHHATVTNIETDPHGRKLTGLKVSSTSGKSIRIVPRFAVLAAGGIENPRLLLASAAQSSGSQCSKIGVGNKNGLVGRFLMDHPKTVIGYYRPELAKILRQRLGLFGLKHAGRTQFYTHGFAASPNWQRQQRLLNCAAYLSEYRAADDPWDALKRIFARHSGTGLKDIRAVASNPGLIFAGLYRRLLQGQSVPHKLDRLVVDCLVEQVPDPESRMTLSDKVDQFGVALPRLNWKISDLERRTVIEFARLFAAQMCRSGLPEPQAPDWLREDAPEAIPFSDAAHPAGTTRMSADPKTGVVDADCKVHGVEGLFVAGSSVFPTVSHANPTLMITALAIRLADTLKKSCLTLPGTLYFLCCQEPGMMVLSPIFGTA